jgi:hypothetical protein
MLALFFFDGLAQASSAFARPKSFDEASGIDLPAHVVQNERPVQLR